MPEETLKLGPSRLVTFTTDEDGLSPDHCALLDERCPQLRMLTSYSAQIVDRTFVADDRQRDWPRHFPRISVIKIRDIRWSILPPVAIRDEDQALRDTSHDPSYTDGVTLLYAVSRSGKPYELSSDHSLRFGIRSYTQNLNDVICIVVITVVRGPEIDKREVRIQTLVTDNGVIQKWRAAGQQQALADFGPEED